VSQKLFSTEDPAAPTVAAEDEPVWLQTTAVAAEVGPVQLLSPADTAEVEPVPPGDPILPRSDDVPETTVAVIN
jgi:hypothetical protein